MSIVEFFGNAIAQGIIGLGMLILLFLGAVFVKTLAVFKHKLAEEYDKERQEKEDYLVEYGYYIRKSVFLGELSEDKAVECMQESKPKTWWQE